jgi:hypothetical protein
MDSSNLFSHPQEPEFVASDDASTRAVEHPTFSDRPAASAPGATKTST